MRLRSIILLFLVVVVASLLAAPVHAASIPCDTDSNDVLTETELSMAVLNYMGGGGNPELDDVRDASYVYTYWGGKPKTINDSLDKPITIYRPVKRIVALGNYRTEGVKILGESDKLVGLDTNTRTSSMHYYPELANLPDVGTWTAPNYEKIIELHPDILITSANAKRASEAQQKLESAGITVIGLDFYRSNLLDTEISKLGYLLDKEDNASAYIKWKAGYERKISSYLATHPNETNPSVYMEWGTGSSWGKGSTGQAICDAVGGNNIAAGMEENPRVSNEWILSQNPDFIIRTSPSTGWGWNNSSEAKVWYTEMESRSGWKSLKAYKTENIYVINNEIVWGPDAIIGIAYYARWLHPGMDIDPEDVYREYLTQFMNVSYPEGQYFVYPS